MDGARVLAGHLLDLHAALGRGHQHDPAAGAIDDRAQVVLLDDVGRGSDQGLTDSDAFDVHAQNLRADLDCLQSGAGQLHATGLAPPADENLGLDDHAFRAGFEETPRRSLYLAGGASHLPSWNWQSLGQQKRLGVSFLDFHALQLRFWRAGGAGRSPQQPRRRLVDPSRRAPESCRAFLASAADPAKPIPTSSSRSRGRGYEARAEITSRPRTRSVPT